MSYAKHWCFTLNNPTDDEKHLLHTHGEEIGLEDGDPLFSYLIFGREVGESGTPHLQGFFILSKKARIPQIKQIPGLERCHLEMARGTPTQAATYCKKDGDFDEYGSIPLVGTANQWETFRDWVKDQPEAPTLRDVWEAFPSLAARYKGAVMDCIELFGNRPTLVEGNLRMWQHRVNCLVEQPADDRRIIFVVDPEGNKGKSWLCRYWLTERDDTQFLSVGKRDDLAYSISVGSKLVVFDIPRGSMEYLQYGVLEMLKNRVVYSPKYSSQTKILEATPHVVVFCNEHPDMNKLTHDRYKIIEL